MSKLKKKYYLFTDVVSRPSRDAILDLKHFQEIHYYLSLTNIIVVARVFSTDGEEVCVDFLSLLWRLVYLVCSRGRRHRETQISDKFILPSLSSQ